MKNMNDKLNKQPDEKAQRHNARMQRMKKVVDKKIAEATEERGVVILLTGNGKGKSSSAFGMVARALGHGQKVGIIQFIKGRIATGEQLFFTEHDQVDYHVMGDGFTWETQNRDQDVASAEKAWKIAEKMLSNTEYDLLIFDEMTYLFKYSYLDIDRVVQCIENRPREQSVVITGRAAKPELKTVADTVSVIADEKHAFRQGVKARLGIEY
jgi:cob(I)alamin adenosyltransferase